MKLKIREKVFSWLGKGKRSGGINMGRVRSLHIKRAARELLGRYPDKFSTSFEENRKFLDEILGHVGKPLRNRIAGYISTLLKQGKEE